MLAKAPVNALILSTSTVLLPVANRRHVAALAARSVSRRVFMSVAAAHPDNRSDEKYYARHSEKKDQTHRTEL